MLSSTTPVRGPAQTTTSSATPRRRRWLLPIATLLGAAVALTLATPPSPRWDMTCAHAFVAPLEHVGRCDRGTSVRVSSVASDLQSHPLYLVDGRVGGTWEKWMNQLRDPQPWVELSWREAREVAKVIVHHAGERERDGYDTVDFDVSVRDATRPHDWEVVARIRDNSAARSVIDFAPRAVTALRIDILRAGRVDARARIYEVEVHGAHGEGAR